MGFAAGADARAARDGPVMLDFAEPYLLAPSSLTPTALRERAATMLADPAATGPTVLAALPVGIAVAVRSNFLYDAWLVHLGPDAASDLHAHERGYGAVAVVTGTLRETRATHEGLHDRVVTAGTMVTTRPGDTHRLTVLPTGEHGTVALYLASPPRTTAPRIVTNTTAAPVVPAAMAG